MKGLSPPFEWAAAGADGHLYSKSGSCHSPGALPPQPSSEVAGSMAVPATPADDQQSSNAGCRMLSCICRCRVHGTPLSATYLII